MLLYGIQIIIHVPNPNPNPNDPGALEKINILKYNPGEAYYTEHSRSQYGKACCS